MTPVGAQCVASHIALARQRSDRTAANQVRHLFKRPSDHLLSFSLGTARLPRYYTGKILDQLIEADRPITVQVGIATKSERDVMRENAMTTQFIRFPGLLPSTTTG